MSVLDASAVLAVLFDEPGADRVRLHLPGSLMSVINLSEVLTRFVRDERPIDRLVEVIASFGVRFVEFDVQQARAAADLWPATKSAGLSMGDRTCVALGVARGRQIVTAERKWGMLRLSVPIILIR